MDSVKIPEGFYYVGGTKESGIVISDNADDENKGVDYTCVGNQFVWVPVEDYSKFVRGEAEETSTGSGIYKMTAKLSDIFLAEPFPSAADWEKNEYTAMKNSVQKYKGFYIARFEAGKESDKVVSKKNAKVVSVPWGDGMTEIGTTGAVYLSQNMYKDSASVVSTLCYGVQWDAAMNFVSDADHNIIDARSWGNYDNSTGDAKTNSGSSNMNFTTGRNEAWKAKNIYDLAGNYEEWTMESSMAAPQRKIRGGSVGDSGLSEPPSSRSYSTYRNYVR